MASIASPTRLWIRARRGTDIPSYSVSRISACENTYEPGMSSDSTSSPAASASSSALRNSSSASSTTRSSSAASTSRPITAATRSISIAGASSLPSRQAMTCLTPSGSPKRWSSEALALPACTPASSRWRTISSTKNGLPSVSSYSAWANDRDGRLAGSERHQLGGLGLAEAADVELGGQPVAAQLGQGVGERVAAPLGRAVRAQDQHPGRVGGPRQVAQQQQGRPVGPLEVVEHEQHRAGRARAR